jgi:N-acetylneuraminate synthase
MNNSSLEDYTKNIMPYVAHLHISDAVGLNGEGVQIFEGDVDFEKVFYMLKNYSYSWVTEIWSGHLHDGCGTHKALCDLENYYNKLI